MARGTVRAAVFLEIKGGKAVRRYFFMHRLLFGKSVH